MNEKDNNRINNSQEYQDVLERELEKQGSREGYAQHHDMARAFPSKCPSQYSYDFKSIDKVRLSQWAESKGWKWKFLKSENESEEDKRRPRLVLFTKK